MNIVINGVTDLRKKPDTKSERISQLIYGESFEIIENLGEFTLIKSEEGVLGYVKSTTIGEGDKRKYKIKDRYRAKNKIFPFGSYLSDEDVEMYGIPNRYIVEIEKTSEILNYAKKALGVPYLWGGTSDFGYDCSGLVQRLFKFSKNLVLPRNSKDQMKASKTVDDFSSAVKGDLIFFKGHVAIYMGRGKIIHANGTYSSVTINNLFDGSKYSNYLKTIFIKIGRFE
ncbi:MAG: C40 family peptidase [Thermoplasmata archaeon]